MVLVGIAISILLKLTIYAGIQNHARIYDFIASIVITIFVWEGNLWIDNWMNTKYPWVHKTKQRILAQLPIALFYSSTTLYLHMLLFNTFVCGLDAKHESLMLSCFLLGLMITVVILSFEIGGQLLKGWKASLIEVEKYKTESAQAQLQNLKDQINPHFLFNNLSVLSSLVYQNQDKAVEYIGQLSKVYRYLLDNRTNELVRLKDEFKFIDSYIYLIQIRFDNSIHFTVQLDDKYLSYMIPPMSVQMLIENAIKHNEISMEFPLSISISTHDNQLEVKNNFKPRTQVEPSSKSGLQNIRARYRYFTDRPMEVIQNEKEFIVRIPLLSKS